MNNDQMDLLEWELKHTFYYVDYPQNIPEEVWKDGNGKLHHMSVMGLDHLSSSIKLLERDIKYLKESGRHPEIVDILLSLAHQKLSELKEQFQKNTKI